MSRTTTGRPRAARAGLACVAAATMLAACGGGGGGGGGDKTTGAGPSIYPMAVGDRWVYRSWIGDSDPNEKLVLAKATGTVTIQGRAAIVLSTTDAVDGTVDSVQYLAVDDTAVTQMPDPDAAAGTLQLPAMDLLRFPAHPGANYQQVDQTYDIGDYDGDNRDDSLHVVSRVEVMANGSVQTDAGRFDDCVHVRTTFTETARYTGGHAPAVQSSVVDDWYAAGVGLVREDSAVDYGTFKNSYHLSLSRYAVDSVRSETNPPQATLIKPVGLQNGFTVIELGYSEPMDVASVTGDTVRLADDAGTLHPLLVQRNAFSYSFYPASDPLPSGHYTVSVGGGATDLVGNAVLAASWGFDVDSTAPVVVASSPADQDSDVPLDQVITVDFSEDIHPASASGVFQLVDDSYEDIDVAISGRRAIITPRSPLKARTSYQMLVQPSLSDLVGNSMARTASFSFRTDPGEFGYEKTSYAGSSPMAVAVGDVTGHGRNDVVMTNWFYFDPATDYRLFVYPQQPDGTLGAPVSYPTSANYGCEPSAVAVADMNGDGRKDVVIAEGGCGIEILLQDANGQLVAGPFLPSIESHMMRVVDLDGDGRADIVALGWGTGQVAVWKQGAGGTFTGPLLYALEHYGWEDMDVGDVDGDGRPDIVVSSGQGFADKGVGVLHQLADGSFGNPQYGSIGLNSPASIAIGDIDGDGRNEIVAGGWFDNGLFVFHPDGNGAPGPAVHVAGTGSMMALEIADLDGDGRQDIVAKGGSSFVVYRQQADGTLAPGQIYLADIGGDLAQPQSIAVGDINGDGHPDLVGAGLVYMLNRTPSPPASSVTAGSGRRSAQAVHPAAARAQPARLPQPQRGGILHIIVPRIAPAAGH